LRPLTGSWEYCGGETRLVGSMDATNTSYEALESRMEHETNIKLHGSDVSALSPAWSMRLISSCAARM